MKASCFNDGERFVVVVEQATNAEKARIKKLLNAAEYADFEAEPAEPVKTAEKEFQEPPVQTAVSESTENDVFDPQKEETITAEAVTKNLAKYQDSAFEYYSKIYKSLPEETRKEIGKVLNKFFVFRLATGKEEFMTCDDDKIMTIYRLYNPYVSRCAVLNAKFDKVIKQEDMGNYLKTAETDPETIRSYMVAVADYYKDIYGKSLSVRSKILS